MSRLYVFLFFFPFFLPFLPFKIKLPSLGEFFSLLRKMCWQSLPVQLPLFPQFLAVHIFRIKKDSPQNKNPSKNPAWLCCQSELGVKVL